MCGNEPRQHRMTSASSALDQLGQYEPAGHVGILTDTIHARPVVTRTAQSAAGLHKHKHGILTNVYEQKHLSEMQAAHAFQNAAAARPYQQFMQHAPPPLGEYSSRARFLLHTAVIYNLLLYIKHLHRDSQTHACHLVSRLPGMQVNAVGIQSSTHAASSKHSRYQQNLPQCLYSLESMFSIPMHLNLWWGSPSRRQPTPTISKHSQRLPLQ